jgi:hypothetical protein
MTLRDYNFSSRRTHLANGKVTWCGLKVGALINHTTEARFTTCRRCRKVATGDARLAAPRLVQEKESRG